MNSCILKALMLIVGVSLTFPQGWCCTFVVRVDPCADRPATNAKTGDCNPRRVSPCCAAANREAQSSDGPDHSPLPVQDCPCADRIATVAQSSVGVVPVDCGFVLLNRRIDPPRVERGESRDSFSVPSVLTRQLNILYCRWLI